MTVPRPARGSGRRTLLLIALVGFAPIVLSTFFYVFSPRPAATNYGQLLPTAPAPEITGRTQDGAPFRLSALRGRWLLVMAADGACGAACPKSLYATRQARTMQGAELDRVTRVWLVTDGAAPAAETLRAQPGLVVAHVDAGAVERLPGGAGALYIIDPLGNLVLQYPADPDIKGLAKDLRRLLRASSIG